MRRRKLSHHHSGTASFTTLQWLICPTRSEALKDREAVPFYSALDCSRGADDTNFGSASIESSQEGAGTTVPKAAQEKPQQQAPLLSWDDTLERNNLLRSNSAFPSTPSSVRFGAFGHCRELSTLTLS